MLVPMFEKDFGPDAAQLGISNVGALSYDDFGLLVDNFHQALQQLPDDLDDPRIQMQLASIPSQQQKEQFLKAISRQIEGKKHLQGAKRLLDYLNGNQAPQEEEVFMPAAPAIQEETVIEEFAAPADFEEGVDDSNNQN